MAQRERRALVDSMAEVGPEAGTLCGTWTVRDLAAHLVVRERRPDAAPGILLKPFAGYLESVQNKAARRPFDELLQQVRTGPPWWSPLRPVDAMVNLTEMFVHHEDVRRARSDWAPRELPEGDEARLWKLLHRLGKMAYRKSPVRVVLENPGGERIVARDGEGAGVVLTGPASELVLHAFGRNEVRLAATGDDAEVAAVYACDRSV